MRVQPETIVDVYRAEVRRSLAEREASLSALSDEEGCGAVMAALKVAAIWPAVENVIATCDAACASHLRLA